MLVPGSASTAKRKQSASEPAPDAQEKIDAEEAARQVLENFLNNQ